MYIYSVLFKLFVYMCIYIYIYIYILSDSRKRLQRLYGVVSHTSFETEAVAKTMSTEPLTHDSWDHTKNVGEHVNNNDRLETSLLDESDTANVSIRIVYYSTVRMA